MLHYVYLYRDTRPEKGRMPIYVGKGSVQRKSDTHHRAFSHWLRERSSNPPLVRVLSKIRKAGLEPVIEVVRYFKAAKSALALEQRLVKKYGRRDLGSGTLLNLTDGGDGVTNWVPDEEWRENQSAIATSLWQQPDYVARQKIAMTEVNARPRVKRAKSIASKRNWKNPIYVSRVMQSRQQTYATAEFKTHKSDIAKDQWSSPEFRLKVSRSQRKSWTAERKATHRAKHLGAKRSPETCARISAALLARSREVSK